MLRIHPQSYEDFSHWCGLLGVTGVARASASSRVPRDAPSLDAPYQDLPLAYLDRLLSWEGIGNCNLVAGLPETDRIERRPTAAGDELLTFPVLGFIDHLRALEPGAFERAAKAGSLREYNRNVGPKDERLTDEEDLALVVAEIAEFCVANRLVLAIRY